MKFNLLNFLGHVAGTKLVGMQCPFMCMVVQHVHTTESTFQPITDNDQNSLCSCIGKTNILAINGRADFDWDQNRKLIVLMMLMKGDKPVVQ